VQTSPSWWIKIGDFGVTKRVKVEDSIVLHAQAGTLGYQAPEIRGLTEEESSIYTNAVNIWSFGCVVYKLFDGNMPFQTSSDLKSFCCNRLTFPVRPLEGKMSEEGAKFLQSILKPKFLLHPTAALQHTWLTGATWITPLSPHG
jgi:serine/threonine protein kinase